MNTELTDTEKEHIEHLFFTNASRTVVDFDVIDTFCIVLRGRLISIRGRHIWPTETSAKNALSNAMRKIARSTQRRATYSYKQKRVGVAEHISDILTSWVNDNTLVIPYRDYIYSEQHRDKTR